jgi:short-subunit dehydrogenase
MRKLGILDGAVALITGGGGEIGGAIARRLASEGAKIVVSDIRRDACDAVAAEIVSNGGEALSLESDSSNPTQAQQIVEATIKRFGKLTTYVNTPASTTPDSLIEDLSFELWNEALAVNLSGAFLMCKYAIPHIRDSGGGTIIMIASQLGQIGVPMRAAYSTTKAALIQLTKCLAVDHAVDNIRVNSISPGSIDTRRTLRRYGTRDIANKARGPLHLLGRTGRADEIAAGALFLASDESSFMTGADLLLDGGYLAFKGLYRPEGRPRAPSAPQ